MNKKILLVDSDPMWQRLCQIKFRETFGLDVVCVSDSVAAREVLAHQKPSAILMDIMLPGQDGLAFTEEIKNNPELKHIPVICVSSLSHPDHVHHSIMAGASAYVNKKTLEGASHLVEVVRQFI